MYSSSVYYSLNSFELMTRLFTVDSQLGILILMIADILVVTHQSINQSILVY